MNTDKHTKLRYSPITGKTNRQWLHYADDTFEPVRKDGNIKRKYHTNTRMMDWWVVDKPQDWNPAENGFNVSLNHDYGEEDKPGGKAKGRQPEPERSNFRLNGTGPEQSQQVKYRQTSLGKGAAGCHEHEARQKTKTEKPKSSTQDSAKLKQKEREQARDESWAHKHLTPPLWKPRGNPSRDWAEGVLKNKLQEWGDGMKHSGHWSQGPIEELGKDDATWGDIPRGLRKGIWPW